MKCKPFVYCRKLWEVGQVAKVINMEIRKFSRQFYDLLLPMLSARHEKREICIGHISLN